jgi:hypothetical protein
MPPLLEKFAISQPQLQFAIRLAKQTNQISDELIYRLGPNHFT